MSGAREEEEPPLKRLRTDGGGEDGGGGGGGGASEVVTKTVLGQHEDAVKEGEDAAAEDDDPVPHSPNARTDRHQRLADAPKNVEEGGSAAAAVGSKRQQRGEERQTAEQELTPLELEERLAREWWRSCRKRKVAVVFGYCGFGYQGLQYNPGGFTIESELEKAVVAGKGIAPRNAGQLKKVAWNRACRTDKGVHAQGNVVTFKCLIDPADADQAAELGTWEGLDWKEKAAAAEARAQEPQPKQQSGGRRRGRGNNQPNEDPVEYARDRASLLMLRDRVNASLPDTIRVFSIQRVLGGFHCKNAVDFRLYEYLLPVRALATDEDWAKDGAESFELSDAELERFRQLMHCYEGTRNFHNFTTGKKFTDADAKRFMNSVTVTDPFFIDYDASVVDVDPKPDSDCATSKPTDHLDDATMEPVGEDSAAAALPKETGDGPVIQRGSFVKIQIQGQSFMLHQIRRMISMALIAFRCRRYVDDKNAEVREANAPVEDRNRAVREKNVEIAARNEEALAAARAASSVPATADGVAPDQSAEAGSAAKGDASEAEALGVSLEPLLEEEPWSEPLRSIDNVLLNSLGWKSVGFAMVPGEFLSLDFCAYNSYNRKIRTSQSQCMVIDQRGNDKGSLRMLEQRVDFRDNALYPRLARIGARDGYALLQDYFDIVEKFGVKWTGQEMTAKEFVLFYSVRTQFAAKDTHLERQKTESADWK